MSIVESRGRTAMLVSWCERNWGEYKMPLGRGNGVKSVGVRRRALQHPNPRVFCTLPSFARIKRQRWRLVGGTQQSTSTISRKKIGYCEQSTTFSNSLTIHQVKTKKITTVKEVHKFWRFYFSVYSFCFDWEDISNTSDSVSSAIQTPRISSKILLCASYFQLFLVFGVLMKHCLSCLVYYFKHAHKHDLGTHLGYFQNLRRASPYFLHLSPPG